MDAQYVLDAETQFVAEKLLVLDFLELGRVLLLVGGEYFLVEHQIQVTHESAAIGGEVAFLFGMRVIAQFQDETGDEAAGDVGALEPVLF